MANLEFSYHNFCAYQKKEYGWTGQECNEAHWAKELDGLPAKPTAQKLFDEQMYRIDYQGKYRYAFRGWLREKRY